jgi:sphinganine-1-phosphate aldolase
MQSSKKGFPTSGLDRQELRERMRQMRCRDVDWRRGRTALHIYHPGDDVLEIAREAYAMFMMENALAPAAFPSLALMEQQVVDGALALLNAPSEASGSFTSGGTESIFLALKSARDYARARGGNGQSPAEIILSRTAHPAFDKAAEYLGIKVVRIHTKSNLEANLEAMFAAVGDRTIMIVASAPAFPYGMVDPVTEIARFAQQRDVWLHVDACIGGFLAPFAKRLGYPVPDFDFTIPGVRSMSADLHKFGYAAKGASLVLYAHRDYAKYQHTEFSNWPKGKYRTATVSGTRPGGAIAAAWAVMNYLGEDGYLRLSSRAMKVWREYLTRLDAVSELAIVGKPHLAVVSFASTRKDLDVFAVADALGEGGWYVSRLAEPPGIHQIVNLAHESIIDEYFDDLSAAVRKVRNLSLKTVTPEVITY